MYERSSATVPMMSLHEENAKMQNHPQSKMLSGRKNIIFALHNVRGVGLTNT